MSIPVLSTLEEKLRIFYTNMRSFKLALSAGLEAEKITETLEPRTLEHHWFTCITYELFCCGCIWVSFECDRWPASGHMTFDKMRKWRSKMERDLIEPFPKPSSASAAFRIWDDLKNRIESMLSDARGMFDGNYGFGYNTVIEGLRASLVAYTPSQTQSVDSVYGSQNLTVDSVYGSQNIKRSMIHLPENIEESLAFRSNIKE